MAAAPRVTELFTKAELVTFVNVPQTQSRGRDVTVQFSLGSKVKACSQDWVGIFRSEWGSENSEPLAYQWAQGRMRKLRSVTFPSAVFERLGDLTETFLYVYVDKLGNTLGVSHRFKVAGGHPEPESSRVKRQKISAEVKLRKTSNKEKIMQVKPLVPVCLPASDDEWDFVDSHQSLHSLDSTSDMSDIVVLSTSPSKCQCGADDSVAKAMTASTLADKSESGFPCLPSRHNNSKSISNKNVNEDKGIGKDEYSESIQNMFDYGNNDKQKHEGGVSHVNEVDNSRTSDYVLDIIDPSGCSSDGAGLEDWRRSHVPSLGAAMMPRFKAKYKAKKCYMNELSKRKSKKAQLTASIEYKLRQGHPATLLTKKKRDVTKDKSCEVVKESLEGQFKKDYFCNRANNEGHIKGFCCEACKNAKCYCNPCTVKTCTGKCFGTLESSKNQFQQSKPCTKVCCTDPCVSDSIKGFCCEACKKAKCYCNPCTVKKCTGKCFGTLESSKNQFQQSKPCTKVCCKDPCVSDYCCSACRLANCHCNPCTVKDCRSKCFVKQIRNTDRNDTSIQGKSNKLKELCKFTVGSSDQVISSVEKKSQKFQKVINTEKRRKMLFKARKHKLNQNTELESLTCDDSPFDFSAARTISTVREYFEKQAPKCEEDDTSLHERKDKPKDLSKFTIGSSGPVMNSLEKKKQKRQKAMITEKRRKSLVKAREHTMNRFSLLDSQTDDDFPLDLSVAEPISSVRTMTSASSSGELNWPHPTFIEEHKAVFGECRQLMPPALVLSPQDFKAATNGSRSDDTVKQESLLPNLMEMAARATCLDPAVIVDSVRPMLDHVRSFPMLDHVRSFTGFISAQMHELVAEMVEFKDEVMDE